MKKKIDTKWVIGIIVTLIVGALVPLLIFFMNRKKDDIVVYPAGDGIMIEQKAIFPGGGSGDSTITKTITIKKKTNK